MERNLNNNQGQPVSTTQEQIPHSGIYHDEYPVDESPKKLDEVQDEVLRSIRQADATVADITPTEVLTQPLPEKKKLSTKAKVMVFGAAGLTALGVVGAAIGIGANAQGTAPEDPKTAAEIEEDARIEKDAEIQEFKDEMDKISVEEFESLPQEVQLKYAYFLIDTQDLETYNLDIPPYTEPSKDLSAQQISDNAQYLINSATTQTSINSEGNTVLYKEDAIKALSGIFDDLSGDPQSESANYNSLKNLIEKSEKPFAHTDRLTADDISEAKIGEKNGETIIYKDILTQASTPVVERFIYRTFTDIDGNERSTWLHDFDYAPGTEPPVDY